VIRPGPQGAHNWHPMSFNPRTGLVYLPTQELPFEFTTESPFTVRRGFWNAGAIAGGAVPDLRKSPRLGDAAVWSRIVTGELGGRGMPGFGEQLTPADAELIRGYVAKQAARP
jgi:hypothetical protein